MHDEYCKYYQAKVLKEKTWFLSACLRNEANLVFARAIPGQTDTFEFFVPEDQEVLFLEIMKTLEKKGIIRDLEEKPNRLECPKASSND